MDQQQTSGRFYSRRQVLKGIAGAFVFSAVSARLVSVVLGRRRRASVLPRPERSIYAPARDRRIRL